MRARRAKARDDPELENQLERDYAQELELRRKAGEIRRWVPKAIRLRIGTSATYKPDFLVVTADGEIQLHETKGHFREAAKVRIKAAAWHYPEFRFLVITRDRKSRRFVVDEVEAKA